MRFSRGLAVPRGIFLTTCCVLWHSLPAVSWAQSHDEPAGAASMRQGGVRPSESPQDLQQAIERLHDPRDHQRSSEVFDAISRHPDEAVRRALVQQFDQRMGELLAGAAPSGLPELAASTIQSSEESALRTDLEALELTSRASVDDLRRRDALVAQIARVPDPTLRYELLERLREREREARRGTR